MKLESDVLSLWPGELNANEAQGPVSESQHHICAAWAPAFGRIRVSLLCYFPFMSPGLYSPPDFPK